VFIEVLLARRPRCAPPLLTSEERTSAVSIRHSLARLRRSLLSGHAARKPQPRSRRSRLELEALEQRCVPAFISVTVTFINQTPSTLQLVSTELDHGQWDSMPPNSISPGASATWKTESNGFATGTEGRATYQIGNDPTLQTTLHWDDPFVDTPFGGTNTFDESAPAGYVASANGPDEGNNISAAFAITLNDAARTFPVNSSSWTAIDPGAIFTSKSPTNPGGNSPPTVSGRVTGLAVDPTTDTIYAATAGGGVWKDVSNSSGTNPDSPVGNSSGDWVPLTDNPKTPAGNPLLDSKGNPIPNFFGAIAIAPSNPQVIYAGTGEANNNYDGNWGEGILVSQDGGATWALTGESLLKGSAISKIVIDPNDPTTAWVAVSNNATNGNSGVATGIYKTTNGLASLNGGTTAWADTITAPANTTAPNNASGQPTIKDSTDPWSDVVIDPATTTKNGRAILYAAVGRAQGSASNGVYWSIDSGATWYPVAGAVPGVAGAGRISLAISHPSGSATLYASIANPGTGALQAFDVSIDGGSTWTQQASTPNFLQQSGQPNGQGFYDNVVLADPNTPTTVYAGGQNGSNTLIESTDGGATWTDLTTGGSNGVSPHGDHHALVMDGAGRVLDGNDGGVWRLDANNLPSFSWEDLNGWETLNAPGLSINQITGFALSPAGSQMILTGSQDNGTNIFEGGQSGTFVSAWTNVAGNDGGYVRIDPTDTNPSNPITAFTSFGYGTKFINHIANLGTNSTVTDITGNSTVGITTSDTADFYPPYVIDPNNAQRLILGTNKLYVTTDQGGSGGDWTVLGGPTFPTSSFAIDSIAIAPSDSQSKTIYVGASDNSNRASAKLYVSKDGGSTWTDITPAIALAGGVKVNFTQGVFRGLAVSPTDPNTAYVTVSDFTTGNVGEVWQLSSTDGKKWTSTDITGKGLPNVPVDSIVLVPSVNAVVVGTDVGVYATGTVSGAKTVWTRVGSGMPNVQVVDLQTATYTDTGTIVAAGTHGRGVWEIQVSPTVTVTPGGVLILSGSALGGSFTVQLKAGDASTLQVYLGTALLKEVPFSSLTQIQVNAGGGTSTLALNFANGNPIPAGGVSYDGSGAASATLVLKGQLPTGPFVNEVDTPTGPHSGTISLDGSTITYTNLTPIIDTAPAANLTIQGTTGADTVNVVDDPNGTENGFQATEVNSPSFEKVDFANKTHVTVVTGPTAGSVVNVQSTPAGVTTSVLDKAAATVNVGSKAPATGGTVDAIAGPLAVTNSVGKGTLNVDDTGSSRDKTGYLTDSSVTGLGMAGGITYGGMQAVNVGLGSGNDTFNVASTSAVTTVTGGAGHDIFNVGSLAPYSGGSLDHLAGRLTVSGAASGTNSLVFDDQLEPLDQTYTLTNSTFASLFAALVTYSNMRGIAVNGGIGNDTLVVDSSNSLVNVPAGINYDGGTGFNALQLVQTGGVTQTSDVYSVGPGTGMGTSTITGPGGTQAVFIQNVAQVTDLVPAATLTVNATPANNAISYAPASNTAHGLVSVDNFAPVEFANKTNLAINSLAGVDTVSLNNPYTPTGLTAITVTGGDPTSFDTLIVNGVAATVGINTANRTITGAAGGGTVPITYSNFGSLVASAGPSNTLAVSGSAGYVYTPATANDAGSLQTGAIPITFSGLGSGKALALTGAGGSASLVVNGTTANDTFVVANSAVGGQVNLNLRATILTTAIPTLTLEGVAGNDTFTLVPAIAASPYATLNLHAGPAASTAGSQANLTAAAATPPLVLSGQVVTQGGKTVAGSGLANENLNAAGNDLTYNGVAGVTENINVIASPTVQQGQVSVPGVAVWSFSNVPVVYVNGNPADNDTLTFTGTNNSDTFQINLAVAGTDADPVLKLQDTTAHTLLTLGNYTGFQTLNLAGLDGADVFNVYVAPVTTIPGRQIFINADLPSGKKLTDTLNVFFAKPRPKIVHSTATQDPDAGLVSADYGTGLGFFLIQFDGIEKVTIQQQ
jgi:hypothetical protein